MTDWIVQIDPATPGRTMLDLNSGPIRVGGDPGTGIDWGTAEITEYATQAGQYGNGVADFVIPNRSITIPLGLGMDDSGEEELARSELAMKVALLQREGGQLLRQRNGGPAMYADIVSAQITIPDVYGETGGVESNVSLVLECLPDFYGDEITLDTVAVTGGTLSAVLTQDGEMAVIEGDYPARCRIVVNETAGDDRHGLIQALRSRHYDSASTAALVYEAEALSPINGSTIISGGSYSGDAVSISIPETGVWTPMLLTSLADGSALTHQGTYRVLARVDSGSGGEFRLTWSVGTLAVPITNDPIAVTEGLWLVDLGVVRLDPQPVGATAWYGVVQTYGNVSANVAVDQIILVPLDEAASQLTYIPNSTGLGLVSSATETVAHTLAQDSSNGGIAWTSTGTDDFGMIKSGESGPILSQIAKFTNWGFSIPGGARIAGIVAQITCDEYDGSSVDSRVSLIQSGTIQSTNRSEGQPYATADRLTTYETHSFGSASDLWGASWTAAEINASNFGFAAALEIYPSTAADASGAIQMGISASMTVYYSTDTGFAIPDDAVLYAYRTSELRTDGMFRTYDGSVYGPISTHVGDLPRLPASGVENRPVELLLRPSTGDLSTEADGFGSFTATVSYWPCWLSRP